MDARILILKLNEMGMRKYIIARKLGVSRQHVTNIANGHHVPSFELAVKIAKLYTAEARKHAD